MALMWNGRQDVYCNELERKLLTYEVNIIREDGYYVLKLKFITTFKSNNVSSDNVVIRRFNTMSSLDMFVRRFLNEKGVFSSNIVKRCYYYR